MSHLACPRAHPCPFSDLPRARSSWGTAMRRLAWLDLMRGDFGWLLSANTVSNLGDGMRLAAGPLLVASLTTDPVLVAGAVFAQQVPWVLLSLPAGAWADRVDRRRLLVGVNLARAGLAAGLVAAIATGRLSLPLIYVVVFAVGTAEVVADTSSSSLVPALVDDDDLPRANASLVGVFMVGNQFAGPPVGAWAFAVAAALPFGLEAAGFVVAALLLSRITSGAAPRVPPRLGVAGGWRPTSGKGWPGCGPARRSGSWRSSWR